MKKVEIKNAKLIKILEQRGELMEMINNINEQLVELDKERKSHGYKMDALKDKTKVIMDKLNPELGEFEIVSRVYLEDGKAFYDVDDMVEMYKEHIREQRKNENTTNK